MKLSHALRAAWWVAAAACLWPSGGPGAADGRLGMPLATTLCPTSSFGELRATHIHAGLDFSTGGRTGVPALAVDTCWVWRVSVRNSGYGRALYVMLPDGEVALYGHLSRFAGPIESAVVAEENRLGLYEVELYYEPGRFRFAPGDTIALSGDTGAGPPHLHFELRSGQVDHLDLNPLPARLALPESVPPVIHRLRIAPLGPDSEVNGGTDEVSVAPSAPGVLEIAGPFGASVYATDIGLCERSLPPVAYEAWIDDAPVWRLEFDQFPFAKSHFSRVLYQTVGSAEYVRLYDRYGLDLEGFNHYAPRSLRFFGGLSDGPHILRVKVTDVWGNFDEAVVPFRYGNLPRFETCSLERCAEGFRVKISGAGKDVRCEASFRRSGGAWQPVELGGSGAEQSGLVPGSGAGLEVVARLADPSGFSREAVLAPGRAAGSDPARIEVTVHPDYLEICGFTTVPPGGLPIAEVTGPESSGPIVLQPVERNSFRGCYALGNAERPVEVRVVFTFGDLRVERACGLSLGLVERGRSARLSGRRFRLRLEGDKRRTFRTLVKITEEYPAAYPGYARCEGRMVFEPRDAFFENGVGVYLDSPAVAMTEHHGLFAEAGGRLSLVGVFDSSGACRSKIYTLDPLVVLEDDQPPVFRWTSPITRARDGTATITAGASDSGSGIDSGTIRAFVDGSPAIASYDPDTGAIKMRTIKPLPYGTHRLRLEARDRLGNTGRSEIVRDLLK